MRTIADFKNFFYEYGYVPTNSGIRGLASINAFGSHCDGRLLAIVNCWSVDNQHRALHGLNFRGCSLLCAEVAHSCLTFN
jgi:hypothetical protein